MTMRHDVAETSLPSTSARSSARAPLLIALLLVGAAGAVMFLSHRTAKRQMPAALAAGPKAVTAIPAKVSRFQATRRYVGTLNPWMSADVGPQFLAAYVTSVNVRPGDSVTKGQVLATLDCRNAQTSAKVAQAEAKALSAKRDALAQELRRTEGLAKGGFVSDNELENRRAASQAQRAEVEARQASLASRGLTANDCTLRAPFDGEVAMRALDPGAFVRPGVAIVSLVDRHRVRLVVDVPESDFVHVAPGAEVKIRFLSLNQERRARITRRAPAAHALSRTVRFEVDLPNADQSVPVGTTAELIVKTGDITEALELPLTATRIQGAQAQLFVLDDQQIVHKRKLAVLGELAGSVFLAPDLPSGTLIVSEGRQLLADGDRVEAKTVVPGNVGESRTETPNNLQTAPEAATL